MRWSQKMKTNVFERDCVKAAAAFQWRFYLFSSTHERWTCSLLEVKNFDDRFAPFEKKNLFDDNACVRLEAEYLCANSKFNGVISQQNHTLRTNAELADKLLNALALIKFMRRNYASNLYYWLRNCGGRTFDWIVGHLCRSSCRWNRCCFLHIRFWNETRKRWESLIMKFLSYFENKQKIIHENFPLSSEENAHKAERESRRQISDFLFFNRWFKTRIQVQFRTWKSQTLCWLSRKLFIMKSVRKNIFRLFLIAL